MLGSGCGSGDLCVPNPPDPLSKSVCIYRDGNHACPTDFANKSLAYLGYTDTRDCTACGCGTANVSCGGKVTAYYAGGCDLDWTGDGYTVPRAAGSCTKFNQSASGVATVSFNYAPAVTSATCPSTGGSPTGTVSQDASKAITICCQPWQ